MWPKILLCALQIYFLVVAFCIERAYCQRPLTPDDPGLLMATTYEFSVLHNRLFLQRPEWLRSAVCISAIFFPLNYLAVLVTTIADAWHNTYLQAFLLIFTGVKIYALGFYHWMEFNSDIPPENLLPYWATEGPYLVSMTMVLINIWNATKRTKDKLE